MKNVVRVMSALLLFPLSTYVLAGEMEGDSEPDHSVDLNVEPQVNRRLQLARKYASPGEHQDLPRAVRYYRRLTEKYAGTLYRVDFDDQSGPLGAAGNEELAAQASFRFDDATGAWTNPAVPHHIGGSGGGVAEFSRSLTDSTGATPITWTHRAGDAVRANNPQQPDRLHGDFWFFTAGKYVD